MKIVKIFAITIFASVVFGTACSESRLDEKPIDQFQTEDAIHSEGDMRAVLNGVYDQYSSSSAFGADILIFGDLISDNVFISAQPSDVAYKDTGFLNWSADISNFGMINPLYNGIGLANMVINNNALPETETVANYKGEAHIARAVGYFYLVSFYSPNPTSGVNQEFGVPLNLGDYDPTIKAPRATVAEVYTQIIDDLTKGIKMMTNEVPTDKGYLSPTAARLLLSRVYLTRGQAGDYQKAIEYADQAINLGAGAGYSSVDKTMYVKYFNSTDVAVSENQPETVWEINMNNTPSENLGINDSMGSLYAYNGKHKRFMFTENFRQSFADGDVRKSLFTTLLAPAEDKPKGVWGMKYITTTSEGPFTQNIKVFRLSEAYLNKIEALTKLGNTTEALKELNDFAASRNGSTYTSASIENVLTERRKEFFGEGQRFFDLKRNNMGFSKDSNCYSVVCEVAGDSKLFVIPMPTRELYLNPNMTQYPGW